MARKHTSVSNANSPGTASDQGVAHWPVDEQGEIVAVTDIVYTQREYGVIVSVLDNDIGENLVVTSVTVRDVNHGTVSTDGTTVTYEPNASFFDSLACGESYAVTLDYSIQDDNGNTDDGLIVVYVNNQSWAWIDEDNSPVLDEDDAFIAQCGVVIFEWWLDEDGNAVIDEDEHVLVSES